jgi:hypothetical protein
VVSLISTSHSWGNVILVHQGDERPGPVGSTLGMASDGDTDELGESHTGEDKELEKNE